jgi:AcrR family transcriptional regulator
MSDQDQSRKIYQGHRDRQRESLIAAAEALFARSGIDAITLGEIATQAGLTRATLYKYFANKQEIAWAILQTYFEALRDSSPIGQWEQRTTGYERVEAYTASLYEFFWGSMERARFMAQFDHAYASEWEPGQMVHLLQDVLGERQRFLVEAIRLGVRDGSLRPDLDPELTAVTLTNAVIGIERRLALMPRHVEAEYGQPVEAIYRMMRAILLQGIRSRF